MVNREGWFLKDAQGDFTGECDKSGDPYLYKNLDHDDIFYFKGGLKEVLKSIWKKKLRCSVHRFYHYTYLFHGFY